MALMTDKQKIARNIVEITPADARRKFKVKVRSVEMWTGMMVATKDQYADPDTGELVWEIPEIRLIPTGGSFNYFEKDDSDPDNPAITTRWELLEQKGFVFLTDAPAEIQRRAKNHKAHMETLTEINDGARRKWTEGDEPEEKELDFTHAEALPDAFVCPEPDCEKAFNNPQKLKMHMKSHTHTFNEQPS